MPTSILGVLIFMVLNILLFWILYGLMLKLFGQKTRSTQQRRVFVPGSRQRQMSVQGDPTIFVSPANLPPPPKYEAMAPPSYEEVMGVHYPAYQQGQQPIVHPLTHALAQGSSTNTDTPNSFTINVTNNITPNSAATSTATRPNNAPPTCDAPAIVSVTTETRRPSAVSVRA